MQIGYVGLGAMGRALATHLARKGGLLVWDLNPAAVTALEAEGAEGARSMADLGARCDVVILCLPKSANVRQALFGKDGLSDTMRPGSIVVDQTSGMPSETRAFAVELAARGIQMIDAPVAGGVPGAIAGQITIMASGDEATFAKVEPALKTISPKLFHCSSNVGDGQALKAINNVANAANRMMTLEMLAVARRLGLEAAAVTDALNAGEGRSFSTQRLLPAVVAQGSSNDFALGLYVKDVNQAALLAAETGAAMPISDATRGLIHLAYNVLGHESRLDDLVQFMERATDTPFVAPLEVSAPMAQDKAMALVDAAMAICNRMIILENVALALRAGMEVSKFSPVIESGSASSLEAQRLFDGLLGRGADTKRSLQTMRDVLTEVTLFAAEAGVPMLTSTQVLAQCQAIAKAIGPEADLDQVNSFVLGAN